MFKSTLAKVRWRVSHVVPEIADVVSSLAQIQKFFLSRDHVRQLNLVAVTLREMNQAGQAQIVLPRLKGEEHTVVTPLDASFA